MGLNPWKFESSRPHHFLLIQILRIALLYVRFEFGLVRGLFSRPHHFLSHDKFTFVYVCDARAVRPAALFLIQIFRFAFKVIRLREAKPHVRSFYCSTCDLNMVGDDLRLNTYSVYQYRTALSSFLITTKLLAKTR